jgi:hypothetical protein
LDAIGKSSEEIKAMQKALHTVYKILKGIDNYIKFIFLTGVSKFAGLSVFSALNNPDDITLSEEYAAICGITQEELESNFAEYNRRCGDETVQNPRKTVGRHPQMVQRLFVGRNNFRL